MATECSFETCDRPVRALGLCRSHKNQFDAGTPLRPIRSWVSKRPAETLVCAIAICEVTAEGPTGLCPNHARIARIYSLSPADYTAMYALGCSICERDDVVLSVDHDHACCPRRGSCGKCVRGMACQGCNLLLGWLDKVPMSRERALAKLVHYYDGYAEIRGNESW